MSNEPCARCGKPATGTAYIDGKRYCHGSEDYMQLLADLMEGMEPTCYMRESWEQLTATNSQVGSSA